MEECNPAEVEEEDTSDLYCITQWWPVTCAMSGDGTACRTGSGLFSTMLECNPNYVAVDAMAPVATDGWCVSSWWPKACALVSSGTCAGWYPGDGHATEAACLA